MKRLALAIIILVIPIVMIAEGLEKGRDGLAKAGLIILLSFIILGIAYGEDKMRGRK